MYMYKYMYIPSQRIFLFLVLLLTSEAEYIKVHMNRRGVAMPEGYVKAVHFAVCTLNEDINAGPKKPLFPLPLIND